MTYSIELLSTAFLDDAREALQRVRGQIDSQADTARDAIGRAMAKFREIGEIRLEELRDAQLALDSVDEDEDDWYERSRCDEALEALQQYRRAVSQIEAAGQRFNNKVGMLTDRGTQLTHAGLASLERRIAALSEYQAEQAPPAHLSSTSTDHGPAGKAAVDSENAPIVNGVKMLPRGFGWINLNELDEASFVDDPADFKKANYADMVRGLEILRDEIIPALHQDGFSREDAERIDQEQETQYTAEGWIHPESRVTVWKAFLDPRRDADVVVIDRGADGKYHVASGRHRLGLARQLGISEIPVKILGDGNGA